MFKLIPKFDSPKKGKKIQFIPEQGGGGGVIPVRKIEKEKKRKKKKKKDPISLITSETFIL